MVENQPYTPETTNPAESGVDSRQENLSKEADDLKKLIDSKNTEEINSKLNDNFLNNLENWLHPDTAIQLKTAIEQVDWYNTEGTNLNKLYKYVVSICDAFDKDEQDNSDHESITENYNIELNDNVKRIMNGFIAKNDMMNIVFQDEKLSSQLSAIKGILNWEQVSWSVIVNMAEFLGIKIKSDDRYGRNRIRKLWNKIFSTDNPNSLFKWLENKYEQVSKSEKITAFRANPFDSGHSLNDVYNFLKIGNRNWWDIDKDNQQVKQFCEALGIDSTKFAEDFSKKNTERKTNNETKLWEVDIKTTVDMSKIIKKTEADNTVKVYLDKWDWNKEELTQENFMTILEITKEKVGEKLQWTQFVGNELETAIVGKQESWFNAIKDGATEVTEPEQPQVESLETSQITVNLFNNISADDVKDAVDAAKEHLNAEWLDPADKETFTARITAVIAALKDGWQEIGRGRKPWHENIKKLQETIQNEINLTPRLRPDWKLWRLTLYAMQKYMWVETGKSGDLKYECGHMLGSELSGMLENFEDQDYLSRALGDTTSDLQWLQDKAESYIRNPLLYVKNKLNNSSCEVPWKEILKSILDDPTNKNKIKLLQFALLPEYTWNIDGIIWPSTTKALQSYVDKNRWWDASIQTIKPLWTPNDTSSEVPDITSFNQSDWENISDNDNYENWYARIGDTMKFFDGTTIRKLQRKTLNENDVITWVIKGKEYIYDWSTLCNKKWEEYDWPNKDKYIAHFNTANTTYPLS